MLHSFKHAAPASLRRPSQDDYQPGRSEPQPRTQSSGDFKRAAHQRRSLDVRRTPTRAHSSLDLFRAPARRRTEPAVLAQSSGLGLTDSPPGRRVADGLDPDLEGGKQQQQQRENPAVEEEEEDEQHLQRILAEADTTASPITTETPLGEDGQISSSPTTTPSAEKAVVSDNKGPPPLPYCLWDHKLSITFFWFLILAESCFVPISLYYGLIYGTNLRHGARKS